MQIEAGQVIDLGALGDCTVDEVIVTMRRHDGSTFRVPLAMLEGLIGTDSTRGVDLDGWPLDPMRAGR